MEHFHFIVEKEKQKLSGAGADFDRVLAQAAELCPVLQDLRKHSMARVLHESERVAIAAIFVRHAIRREKIGRIDWTSRASRMLYRIRSHMYAMVVKAVALFVLLSLTYWEPSKTGQAIDEPMIYYATSPLSEDRYPVGSPFTVSIVELG